MIIYFKMKKNLLILLEKPKHPNNKTPGKIIKYCVRVTGNCIGYSQAHRTDG